MEFSEFEIRYKSRTTIKAQVLVNFLVEMVDEKETQVPSQTLYVDGASSARGCGAGVILEKEGGIVVELSIKFDFLVSNNQVEYKALIARLQLAADVGAT